MHNSQPGKQRAIASTAQTNIATVAKLEQDFLKHRTFLEKAADAVANFVGSITFVAMHLVVFAVWMIINARFLSFVKPFDPFPYPLLCMIVSLEGVILSTFVLMKQNRMSLRADQRNHLNLQIDLLAEKEVTKILQLLERMSEKMELGIEQDQEVQELSQVTAVDTLAYELQEKLPEG